MSKASFSWRDRSQEIGVVGLNFADIAAGGGNFNAVVAAVQAVHDAILALTYCDTAGSGLNQPIVADAGTTPASPWANRETGLRVFYSDDVTAKKYTITIPGPELDSLTLVEGSDLVVLDDGDIMNALVVAMQAGALSPDLNAITVNKAVIVGRNN